MNSAVSSLSGISAGIPQETVAAISAAVYAVYPGAQIKSIRRGKTSQTSAQSAWKLAGLLENTRPF